MPRPQYQPPDDFARNVRERAFACLERGGAVIAGNDRAARALRADYAAAQLGSGRAAWRTPRIADWQGWLATLWNQHVVGDERSPLLLNAWQERSVWKRLVDVESGDGEALAQLAANAWESLSDYEQHRERQRPWRPYASIDAQAFQEWAAGFDRECRTHRWMSRSDLPHLLTDAIQRAKLVLPPEIVLVGFDRMTPAQRSLLDAVRAAGCSVDEPGASEIVPRARLVEAVDLRDELAACAWWAKRRLQEERNANIAVIVQNVDEVRGEIERSFREILMPDSLGIESSAGAVWEFSLGQPLSSIPVVKAALLLLRWIAAPLEETEISWLLLCGFLGEFGEDGIERAKLDAELRKKDRLSTQIALDEFIADRPSSRGDVAQQVFGTLRDVRRAGTESGVGQRRRTMSDWLDVAHTILAKASWPGGRTLDSLEYQALDRWERFIGEIAALSFDDRRCSYAEFVTVVDRYARETIFSPESRQQPIQIMGAFESAGQSFDAVWFLGADDGQWPPSAQPNPLLPQALQRRCGMPHASVEVDWQIALVATRRIATSAANCVFSYCRRNDAEELRPSALPLEACGGALQAVSAEVLRGSLGAADPQPHRCSTIEVEDTTAIPWPRHVHAGGVDILKMQSACAFQAFATRRLGAKDLDSAGRGLTPADRGTLLHKVLQALWSRETPLGPALASRDDLFNAKAAGKLAVILSHHIKQAFSKYTAGERNDWTMAYLQVEQERLHLLLSQWLDYEIERPHFKVDGCETKMLIKINGLDLEARADRIDELSDGRLIVDYKTGLVSTSMWAGERPEEPQLPVYAIHGGVSDLKGVLFGQIRAGLVRFSGHVEHDAVIVTNDTTHQTAVLKTRLDEELLGDWADALSNLADRFLAGEAVVSPKSYPKTCKYCALPSLCRVAESAVARSAQDEDSEIEEGRFDSGSSFDE